MAAHDDSGHPVWRLILDPGWLFLIAGLGLLASAVLIPAQDARAQARWQRDRARALEDHTAQRLERYERYLHAVEAGGDTISRSLAASQLNLVPRGHDTLRVTPGRRDASVFGALEPGPLVLPSRRVADTRLRRLTLDPSTRPWVLGVGMLAVLIGLLPVARATPRTADEHDELADHDARADDELDDEPDEDWDKEAYDETDWDEADRDDEEEIEDQIDDEDQAIASHLWAAPRAG